MCFPGTEISISHRLTYLCIITFLWDTHCYCILFTNEETGMVKGRITCWRSYSYKAVELWFKYRQFGSNLCPYPLFHCLSVIQFVCLYVCIYVSILLSLYLMIMLLYIFWGGKMFSFYPYRFLLGGWPNKLA